MSQEGTDRKNSTGGPDHRALPGSAPELWLENYGDALFRYALSRVRSRELAEDLVQQTLLYAIKGRKGFAGQSSEQTWLIGILRHKIVDHYRRVASERTVSERDTGALLDTSMFDKRGSWKSKVRNWPISSDSSLERVEFRRVLHDCISRLPASLMAVFCLRELERLDSEDVCKALSISASNLWTQLHRARLLLRRCLELNWFSGEA